MTEIATQASPSPLPPTEAEKVAWDRLTRDEQLALYRAYLSQPDCDEVSSATMTDILAEARAAASKRG